MFQFPKEFYRMKKGLTLIKLNALLKCFGNQKTENPKN